MDGVLNNTEATVHRYAPSGDVSKIPMSNLCSTLPTILFSIIGCVTESTSKNTAVWTDHARKSSPNEVNASSSGASSLTNGYECKSKWNDIIYVFNENSVKLVQIGFLFIYIHLM